MINRVILFLFVLVSSGSLHAQDSSLKELKLELGAQRAVEGGYVSLTDGFGYTGLEGYYYSERVDFIYLHGKTTGVNLLIPTNEKGFLAFSRSQLEKIETWNHRNKGSLIKLDSPQAKAIFDGIKTAKDLENLIKKKRGSITHIPGYKPLLYGPGTRLTELSAGDVVLFESASSDRIAIAYIESIDDPGTRGKMTLLLKYKI